MVNTEPTLSVLSHLKAKNLWQKVMIVSINYCTSLEAPSNAAGFDNFILLEYFSKVGITPKITMTGCRLIYMYDKCFKQQYIDSYSFMPMRLANMSATLNLSTVEKGHFPHAFNKQENNYPKKHD